MSNTVNVDFITKVIEVEINDNKEESLAAMNAVNAAKRSEKSAERSGASAMTAEECATTAQQILVAIQNSYGYPFTASTTADMTDTSKIYVYVGSEDGYTNGDWYYNNGEEWVSGGTYNSAAVETDKTLSLANVPADAKNVGSALHLAFLETANSNYFQIGAWSYITGVAPDADNNTTIMRCLPYLSNGGFKVANGYGYEIFAYEQDHTYVGIWNGSAFIKTGIYWFNNKPNEVVYFKDINPSYVYRITIRRVDGANIDVATDSQNVIFVNPTDKKLSTADKAADAKVVGDKLNLLNDDVFAKEDVDFSEETTYGYYINFSTNKWVKNSNYGSYFVDIPATAKTVKIVANPSATTTYAFLTHKTYSSGSVPRYATGCTAERLYPGLEVELPIPSDSTVLWVLGHGTTLNNLPSLVEFIETKGLLAGTDPTLSVSGKAADAKIAGDKISAIENILFETVEADLSTASSIPYVIARSDGEWYKNTNGLYQCYLVHIPEGAFDVAITANAQNDSSYAFLKQRAYSHGQLPLYATGCTREDLSAGNIIILNVPSDAKYMYVEKMYNGVNDEPAQIAFTTEKSLQTKTIPLGLHTMPENQGVLNMIKRCRQLTDIEWTPAADLPRYMKVSSSLPFDDEAGYESVLAKNYIGTFKAGVKYKGIPYGRCTSYKNTAYGYGNHYVGLNIDFETFITAVQNPESVISKESVGNVSGHRSIPYAAVCSALASYALNITYKATANLPEVPGLNLVSALMVDGEYIDPGIFKLGDIVNSRSDHVVVITDIVKDANDNVVFIEISEATTTGEANESIIGGQFGGICRRVGFDVESFFQRHGHYYLYRYENIASIPYTPSKFVNVGDELNMSRLENLPCMPYMGEKFKYKVGYIPNSTVVINCNNYSYLRVFKDGEELTNSPYAVASDTKYVDVGFIEAGEYEAYLCNMSDGSNTKITAKCHWSVVEE